MPLLFTLGSWLFSGFLYVVRMGSSQSSDKTVDTAGTVNNNVLIHNVDVQDTEILVLLYIIAIVAVSSLILKLCRSHHKFLRRRYMVPTISRSVPLERV